MVYRKGCHTVFYEYGKSRLKESSDVSQEALERISWQISTYCKCRAREASARWSHNEFVANEYGYSDVLEREGVAMKCVQKASELFGSLGMRK